MKQEKISVGGQEINYRLKKSRRARKARLTIYCSGELVVTIPSCFPGSLVEKIVREKSNWILKKIKYFSKFKDKKYIKSSKGDFLKYKEKALEFAQKRAEFYSQFYGFQYKKITVRNQRTRWGSCSRRGNLSFNYKIILLPSNLADYIVVHEICHLGQFNHSRKFWELVEKTFPDYKKIRKEVRKI
ncbi:MAG TPA: M48 family metallopeptidase [Candidatus Moranbacteria bacterium]|nr:M48 family metallopeptidase [Candidatus Moranbacteria bacterium]